MLSKLQQRQNRSLSITLPPPPKQRQNIQLSGRRLDLYFIDWLAIWSSSKSHFLSLYKEDFLILADLGCWWFGAVREIKETRHTGLLLSNGSLGSILTWLHSCHLSQHTCTRTHFDHCFARKRCRIVFSA